MLGGRMPVEWLGGTWGCIWRQARRGCPPRATYPGPQQYPAPAHSPGPCRVGCRARRVRIGRWVGAKVAYRRAMTRCSFVVTPTLVSRVCPPRPRHTTTTPATRARSPRGRAANGQRARSRAYAHGAAIRCRRVGLGMHARSPSHERTCEHAHLSSSKHALARKHARAHSRTHNTPTHRDRQTHATAHTRAHVRA